MQNILVRLTAASLAVSAATAASAATMINPVSATNPTVTVTLDADDAYTPLNPYAFTIDYNGFQGSPSGVIPGLSASILFNFLGTTNSGKNFNFSYTLTNTSDGDITESRASIFGFNVDPNVSGATSAGLFPDAVFKKGLYNVPNAAPNVELCFKDATGGNCTGGSNGGVTVAEGSGDGTFSLLFAGRPLHGEATLSNFYIKYQSIVAPNLKLPSDSASGLGTPISPVPEPAAWALMIAGFGLVGAALRRRRQPRLLTA